MIYQVIAFGTVALMTWHDHKKGMRWRACLLLNLCALILLQLLILLAEEMTK